MAIDRLEQAARQAMAHPDVAPIFEGLPKSYQNNPGALRRLLIAVAEGHPVSQSPAYKAAHAALAQVEETRALQDKIGELYHDAKIQRAAGDKGIDWYLAHPEAIKEALRDPKIADMLGANLVERIGTTVIETRLFREEHGIPDAPEAPAEPIPAAAGGKLESEIASLRSKSVGGTISNAESIRLDQLYAARIAAEEAGAMPELHQDATAEERASHRKALGLRPDPGDEYRQLIGKSLDRTITVAENARLNQLSGEKAVQSGAITAEDLAAETGVTE
jgi:hypothetical protein